MAKTSLATVNKNIGKKLEKFYYKNTAELTKELDEYAGMSIGLAWEIASNPDHPMHLRFGFEALKLVVQHTAPKRKEITGEGGGPIEMSLSSLFYKNSIPSDSKPAIEVSK